MNFKKLFTGGKAQVANAAQLGYRLAPVGKFIILFLFVFLSISNKLSYSQCIEEKLKKENLIPNNFDGVYNFHIRIKNRNCIKLINNNNNLEFIKTYEKIKKIILKNYDTCKIQPRTTLLIKFDTTEGNIKIVITVGSIGGNVSKYHF